MNLTKKQISALKKVLKKEANAVWDSMVRMIEALAVIERGMRE